MVLPQKWDEFFAERAVMYQFLSHIFFKELTEETIEELATAEYPEGFQNQNLDQGYRLIKRYFAFCGTDRRGQLACEYARIFLAAGVYTKTRYIAVPYESVFTSDEQLIMQDSRDDVALYYLEDGFKVNPDLHEPDDHLSFELEYLAHMNVRAAELTQAQNQASLSENIARQSAFIDTHMLNWLPDLTKTAQTYARSTFYIGVLLITTGYLEEAQRAFNEFLLVA
jgi:TorA maturation chaperone TorD